LKKSHSPAVAGGFGVSVEGSSNDFSSSFVRVIAGFVGQGSFFKIIRRKGSTAHRRGARDRQYFALTVLVAGGYETQTRDGNAEKGRKGSKK